MEKIYKKHMEWIDNVLNPFLQKNMERKKSFKTDSNINVERIYLPRETELRSLDDSLHIFWNANELEFQYLKSKPKLKSFKPKIPVQTHPWRIRRIGKVRYAF